MKPAGAGLQAGQAGATETYPSWGTFTFTELPPSIPNPPLTPATSGGYCLPNGQLIQPTPLTAGPAPSPFSGGPVRYFDGTLYYTSTDLGSAGFGTAWGHTRSWTNEPGYLRDANFNVTALVDTSGDVVERYVYDPYGTVTVYDAAWTAPQSSAYAWKHLHQGGRFEEATGLYHFRNRELSLTLGRWAQNDPIGLAAGELAGPRSA